MDNDFSKWLAWVWVPATGIVVGGFWFLVRWMFRISDAFPKADADLEARLMSRLAAIETAESQALKSIYQSISALDDLTREIREDLNEHRLATEQRFATKDDLNKNERVVEKAVDRLQGNVDRLVEHVQARVGK